ncbi:MAG: NADPH-dependent F420 reductase [Gibbsiella quercinecans]|uniref:NADPH-dependent F420 reductase n=1 Tax=Gibbsiella quercinecans TaxID=929813 RepID=UPI003F37023D
MPRCLIRLLLPCLLVVFACAGVRAEPLPRIGIIGAGQMGATLGRLWVNAGYSVLLASRHPQELQPLVTELGARAQAGTAQQAAHYGEIVVLAVPYGALPELGKSLAATLAHKVVLDVTNPYPGRDGAIGEQALQVGSGVYSARLFPGTRLVRGFNALAAAALAAESNRSAPRIAVPLAGDDPAALASVAELVKAAGFVPVVVGGLDTAPLFQPGGTLFLQSLTREQMEQRIPH